MSRTKNVIVVILHIILMSQAFGQPNIKILGPEQVRQVEDIVLQYKNDCGKKIDPNDIQDKFAKQMAIWKQEPELCDCGAERLRIALTSHLVEGVQLNMRNFFYRWMISDQLRCEMPHVGTRLQQNCVPLFTEYLKPERDKYSSLEETVKTTCTCVSEAIAMTDIEQGIRMALESYDTTLESIKLGNPIPRAAPTPALKRLGDCLSLLEPNK